MTKLLEHALDVVRRLPPEGQDDIARAMLTLAAGDEAPPEAIDPDHLAQVLEGLAQARGRDLADDAAIAAAFRRFDP